MASPLTLTNIASGVTAWELLHRATAALIRLLTSRPGVIIEASGASRDKLDSHGASYFAALVHAVIVSSRGIGHCVALLPAPVAAKLAIPIDVADPWLAATSATEVTSLIFLSWLIYDILHVAAAVARGDQRLGGADTLAHHLGFIASSSICGPCRALPFAFGWLICGEFSSIFLNVRWLLIASGRGATAALRACNVLFAVTFLLGRILLGAAGFVHLWAHRAQMLATPGLCCSKPLLYTILAMLIPGYGLNLFWMGKIVRMARGGDAAKKAA